jgi:signal peptidase II
MSVLKTHSSSRNHVYWLSLISALIALDQAIKIGTQQWMPLYASIEVTNWFNFVHVLNPGAAFSFLANAGGWQRYFFTFTGLTIGFGIIVCLWIGVIKPSERLPFAMIAAGGLANVVDRLYIGAVVDYLDFHIGDWHWPAFNAADIFVMCGAALLLWVGFTESKQSKAESTRNR